MFAKFFIERPILSNVIAIVTMFLGVVAVLRLPVAQYPEITPPTVVVSTAYPGASASVVAETVGSPIEQEVNGVEGMLYMSSTSSSDGSYSLTVTFAPGSDIDMATVLVQNRVNVAQAKLPEEVRRQGLTVKKRSPSILMVVALSSPDQRFDDLYISNFGNLRVKDELSRIPGVGEVRVFGAADYSMRIWLDPDKLKSFGLTGADVQKAIGEQNIQAAAGQIGQPPQPANQQMQMTVSALGRLSDVRQFENIIIKTATENPSGQVVRIKDVARVELGGQTYDVFAQQKGRPAAAVPIYLLPGANALQVAKDIKARMTELAKTFPDGITWEVPFDTTDFIEASISQVYQTLLEAAGLVLLVILIFLQDWRAMLVPATTVPVTILGAFIAMAGLGYSINLITLFALVLAIGIVVDDAIIVVEGAAHHIEQGLSAHDAAIKAMAELFGPIMGITLVLVAVFLPAAASPGITGQIFRQFSLVIAATAVISAINAVTLKPTQCALWLRPHRPAKNPIYRGFNWLYDHGENMYVWTVARLVRHPVISMAVFVVLISGTFYGFSRLPTGFLPTEDQGYAIIAAKLPEGASQARTREVVEKMNAVLRSQPGIAGWISFGGLSLLENANLPNAVTTFITYEKWDKRGPGESQNAIIGSLMGKFQSIRDAFILVFPPPAIRGLGQAGGFEMVLQDRGNAGPKALEQALFGMIGAASSQSALGRMGATYSASTPQLFVDVNRTQAKTYGIPISDIFGALQANLGAIYVNDFNLYGKTYQVRIQADAPYRMQPEAIRNLEVRNAGGKMVPLGSLLHVDEVTGPQVVTRYNLYPAASIFGNAAPGVSSGQALQLMEQVASANLPASMGYEWTSTSYQERQLGNESYYIFAMSVSLVFFVLAGLYESWAMPAAVILVVPLALLGTYLGLVSRGMDNNIYTQVGMILLIALSSKNAILIVEFARELRAKGTPLREAVVEAARRRFRPILMTSFAFIMGVLPLLTASGAGAASQQAVGTAVFGGMVASTALAVAFVPVFVVVIARLTGDRS